MFSHTCQIRATSGYVTQKHLGANQKHNCLEEHPSPCANTELRKLRHKAELMMKEQSFINGEAVQKTLVQLNLEVVDSK